MKKAYLVISHDIFPFFVLEEMNDSGEDYESTSGRGYGVRAYDSKYIIRRVNQSEFEKLKTRKGHLDSERRESEVKFKARALRLSKGK